MSSFFQRIRSRKIVQWTIAYLAAAWFIMQLLDVLGGHWGIAEGVGRTVDIVLLAGLGVTLVLAWFHGERGHQKVTRIELAVLATLLVLGGAGVILVRTRGVETGEGESGNMVIEADDDASVIAAVLPPDPRTLAVLPFENFTADPEQEYFSDGLTEELLNVLARIPGLKVANRTSSFAFKDQPTSKEEIAHRLGVSKFVEGSVRRAGNRLRVTAQLVDAVTGYRLWSESFDDRQLKDWIEIQERIARAIGNELEIELADDLGLTVRTTEDDEAFDLYLRGRHLWNQRTVASLERAVEFFEQAIARDSTFAQAWAGLGDTYLTLPFYSQVSTHEMIPRAREAARRALTLDPNLVEAHTTLAFASALYDWDLTASESQFRRVLELQPGYALALKWYTDVLPFMGRFDDAIATIRQAEDLDPISPNIRTIHGLVHWYAGRDEEALAQWEQALELDPRFPLTHHHKSWFHWLREDMDGFFASREHLERAGNRLGVSTDQLRRLYSDGGTEAVARRMADAAGAGGLHVERARWHTQLGDLDAAFADLERAVKARSVWLMFATVFPDLAPLRADPRYEALLERMGLVR